MSGPPGRGHRRSQRRGRLGDGHRDVDDAAPTAKFDNGAIGTFEATRFAPGGLNKNRREINGEHGSIRFNLERLTELEVFPQGPRAHPGLEDHPGQPECAALRGGVLAAGPSHRLGAHLHQPRSRPDGGGGERHGDAAYLPRRALRAEGPRGRRGLERLPTVGEGPLGAVGGSPWRAPRRASARRQYRHARRRSAHESRSVHRSFADQPLRTPRLREVPGCGMVEIGTELPRAAALSCRRAARERHRRGGR